MSETVVSVQIHSMRGHSRGQWAPTLDDTATSEEDAEYWALFGVTRRGHTHCLGKSATKPEAINASLLFDSPRDDSRKALENIFGRRR